MNSHSDLAGQVALLQRRVRWLSATCLGSWVVLAALALFVGLQSFRVPEVIRARRVEADQVDSEVVTAGTVIVQRSDADSGRLSLGAVQGGTSVQMQDAAGKNQVLLNRHGLHVGDIQGKHALFLGLNPGPGPLHSPFLLMRDRTSKERLTLGLHAESDAPSVRLSGTTANQSNEISADSMMLYNSDGRIVLQNSGRKPPSLEIRTNRKGQATQTTVITPATKPQ